jgi:hypothetical protein
VHNLAVTIIVKLLADFKPTVADGAAVRCKRAIGWKQFAWLTWVWKYWFHDDHQATKVTAKPTPMPKANT